MGGGGAVLTGWNVVEIMTGEQEQRRTGSRSETLIRDCLLVVSGVEGAQPSQDRAGK